MKSKKLFVSCGETASHPSPCLPGYSQSRSTVKKDQRGSLDVEAATHPSKPYLRTNETTLLAKAVLFAAEPTR